MKKSILALVLMTACGSANHGSTSTIAAAKSSSLTGTWSTDCIVANDGTSSKYVLVADAKLKFSTLVYQDTTCTAISMRQDEVKSFTLAKNLINSVVVSYTLTNLDADIKADLDSQAIYGVTNWEVGVAISIAGKQYTPDSAATPNVGTKNALAYKIEGTKLSIATAADPTNLDDGLILNKN